MRFSKSPKVPDKKPASLIRDPVIALRGAGEGRYTSGKLALDRKSEREEEEARDKKPL